MKVDISLLPSGKRIPYISVKAPSLPHLLDQKPWVELIQPLLQRWAYICHQSISLSLTFLLQ